MPNWSKADTTRAAPAKKGDVRLQHNLYDVLGKTLLEGVRTKRLDPRKLKNISANLGLDLGSDYGVNLGYNEYIGDLRQDLKLTISKKF